MIADRSEFFGGTVRLVKKRCFFDHAGVHRVEASNSHLVGLPDKCKASTLPQVGSILPENPSLPKTRFTDVGESLQIRSPEVINGRLKKERFVGDLTVLLQTQD